MNEIELFRRIVQIEYEITKAVRNGHRPFIGDKYQEQRSELNILRCLYFGEDSKFCKKRK